MIARAAPLSRRRRRPRRRAAPDGWERAAWLLAGVLVTALLVRAFVAMPRSIPSESMMPGLLPGDYVLVWKWPYGWSRASLSLAPSGTGRRLFGRLPARGDAIVFRGPDRTDYVKRVVGLPGDRVALRGGLIVLNGRALPRYRIADFAEPVDAAVRCVGRPRARTECRWPRYRETLVRGDTVRAWTVIDQGPRDGDDIAATTVPPGRMFVLGDNRDVSADSRWPAGANGVGLVPLDAIEGRVGPVILSTGGAGWTHPIGWLAGLRLHRIGART